MDLFAKFKNKILKDKYIFYLVIVCLTMILHRPIEILFTSFPVKYLFRYIESTWFNDILFISIAFISIIYVLHRFGSYIPSNNIIFSLIVLTIFYSHYRYLENVWSFTSFKSYSHIRYADLLILFTISNLFLLIKEKSEKKVNGKNAFFEDESLGKFKTDVLGYTAYADLLAGKILSSHFDKSFAIGINGKWGSGKTSFIDILKRALTDETIIEINFNPWNSNSPKAIIQDFFETIEEAIRPYHSSLSRLLISYSNKLVSLNDNNVAKTIQTSVFALTGFETANQLHEDINKALSKIDKKIIVYIDDLDRLDKDEVIEVIRLIRNTANFKNTFFIVAYDRNYINSALIKHSSYRQELFLEKIFQIELTLPYFNGIVFRNKLAEKLKQKFSQGFHATIDEEVIGTPSITPTYLNDWLENMRDVTRIANALILNLSKLNGEVEFSDFLRLELLRIKYPSIYEMLFRQNNFFLKALENGEGKYTFQLKAVEEGNRDVLMNPSFQFCKTTFELYLCLNYTDISIRFIDIKKVVELVGGIFSESLSISTKFRSHLSVIYPSKFYRYFTYNLLDDSLSEIDFSKARALEQDNFNLQISRWVSLKLETQLKERFQEIKTFDDKEDFEKVISAIFHLANQKTFNPSIFSGYLVGYDGKDLFDKLNNYNNTLVARFYKSGDEDGSLHDFVIGLFNKAVSPYSFESDLIRYINGHYFEGFPLTKEELLGISLRYFRDYCSETLRFDNNHWRLFHCCKIISWNSFEHNTFQKNEVVSEEAKDIMKEFARDKDLNGFLLAMIEFEPFERSKFLLSKTILTLFVDWESFIEFIDEQDEEKWEYLKEFKEFLLTYKSNNYSNYVDFSFLKIPVRSKFPREE